MENKCVLQEQFGGWMRVSAKRPKGGEVEGMGGGEWDLIQ